MKHSYSDSLLNYFKVESHTKPEVQKQPDNSSTIHNTAPATSVMFN